MRRNTYGFVLAAFLPLSLSLSLSSCRGDSQRQARQAADEVVHPIVFSLASGDCFATKSIMPLPAIPSVEDGDGLCTAFEVSRIPMDEVKGTRAFAPVTTANCDFLYVDILDVSDNVLYHNAEFEREGGVFRGGVYWPDGQEQLNFCVSNVEVDDGEDGFSERYATIGDATEDVVAGTFYAGRREQGSVALDHVFACVGDLSITPPDGCTATLVSASLSAPTSGVWGFFDDDWSDVGSSGDIALSEGSNDVLCVDGRHKLSVEYELSDGESTRTVEASGNVSLVRGKYNDIDIIAGARFRYALEVFPGNASIAHGASVTLRAFRVAYYVPAKGDEVAIASEDVTDGCSWSLGSSGIVTRTSGTSTFTADGTPGTVTVTASYGGLTGTCTVVHKDYRTGIEVRNIDLSVSSPNGTGRDVTITAAAQDVSFCCDASFEYRIAYASGAFSDWCTWEGWDIEDGLLSDAVLASEYGLSVQGYADVMSGPGGNVYAISEGSTFYDFDVRAPMNHSEDEMYEVYVGIRLAVNGEEEAADVVLYQDFDSFTTECRNLSVSVTAAGASNLNVGPAPLAITLTRSSSVEYHQVWVSGYDEGWKVKSAGTPTLSLSSPGGMTLSGTNLSLAFNNTSARTGVVTASLSYQGLSASSTFTVTQEYAEVDHIDVDCIWMEMDVTQRTFEAIGGSAIVRGHGSYATRVVYDDGGEYLYGDWSEEDTEFSDAIPFAASYGSGALPSWMSYDATTGKLTVKPNYTGSSREATVWFSWDPYYNSGYNDCFCEDGSWYSDVMASVKFTQKPTTIKSIEFGLYSPSHPNATGNFLQYDDVVFRPTRIETEHGPSIRKTETDVGKLAVWNALTFKVDDFTLLFKDREDLPDNGGMTMSPSASGYAGDRSITWNDVWKTLPENPDENPEYQYPRFTPQQHAQNDRYLDTESNWKINYDASVTAKLGSQTKSCTSSGEVAYVYVSETDFKNTSLVVKIKEASGYESLSEHVLVDNEHYGLLSRTAYLLYYYGEYDSRYRLALSGSDVFLGSGNWTDWEHVKFTNVMVNQNERLISWSYAGTSINVSEETSESGCLYLYAPETYVMETSFYFSYSQGFFMDKTVFLHPSN